MIDPRDTRKVLSHALAACSNPMPEPDVGYGVFRMCALSFSVPERVKVREVGPRDGFQNEPEGDPHGAEDPADQPPDEDRAASPRGHELRAAGRDPAAG